MGWSLHLFFTHTLIILIKQVIDVMAKIKDITLSIQEEVVDLRINCSSKGVFSCKIPYQIAGLLGLPRELSGESLKEVEDTLLQAYHTYRSVSTKYSLKIAIDFMAGGSFIETDDPDMRRLFIQDGVSTRFHKSIFSASYPQSELRFSYLVVIEEDINGHLDYYIAHKLRSTFEATGSVVVDGYVARARVPMTRLTLVPYSEDILERLQSIEAQFRNASFFLARLLSSENVPAALCCGSVSLLEQ